MISYDLSNQLLYKQLAHSLRDKILNGTLKPGSLLPSTRELMKIYGISQVTVRKAVGLLVKEDLVEGQPGRGVVVKAPRQESSDQSKNRVRALVKQLTQSSHIPGQLNAQSETLELYSILAVLEGEAVGLAAARVPDSQSRQALSQLDKMSCQTVQQQQEFRRLEQLFHLGIHDYCPNRSLRLLITQVRVEMDIYLEIFETEMKPCHFEEVRLEWQNVFTALLHHNPDLATQRMREHIMAARERLKAMTYAQV